MSQINFSRSPFPALGLTVASGCATRMDPIQSGDKIGRLRLDLEMLYNSVSGCSTEDTVDAHGSEHGTVSTTREASRRKTRKEIRGFDGRSSAMQRGKRGFHVEGFGHGSVSATEAAQTKSKDLEDELALPTFTGASVSQRIGSKILHFSCRGRHSPCRMFGRGGDIF